mgnify:CR=1 FL=1
MFLIKLFLSGCSRTTDQGDYAFISNKLVRTVDFAAGPGTVKKQVTANQAQRFVLLFR